MSQPDQVVLTACTCGHFRAHHTYPSQWCVAEGCGCEHYKQQTTITDGPTPAEIERAAIALYTESDPDAALWWHRPGWLQAAYRDRALAALTADSTPIPDGQVEFGPAGYDGQYHAVCRRCGERYEFKARHLIDEWVALHENPDQWGRQLGCETPAERVERRGL